MRAKGPGTGPARTQRAYTLVELLITLMVAAILLGIGVPSMRSSLERNRGAMMMLELRGLLDTARQEAVTLQTEVTLCGTSDGLSCSTDWNGNPTLVFIDSNRNRRLDTVAERLIQVSELTRSGAIRWRASGGRNYLRFRNDGGVREYGSFTYCPRESDARHARQIIVGATGRARSATDDDGDGIVEDRYGNPLNCS